MKRGLCLILAAALAVSLCGCGETETPTPETTPTTVPWEATAPEVTDISGLLTAKEVSDAVNTTMGDGVLYENGTILTFYSPDYQTQVSVLVEKPEQDAAAYFAALLTRYAPEDLVMAPNLADEAYWCAETRELLVQSGNFVLSVNVVRPEFSAENALIAARQLAALAAERLS